MSQANGKGPHNTDILSTGSPTGVVSLAGAAAEPTPAPQKTQMPGEPEAAHAAGAPVTRTVPDQHVPPPQPMLAPSIARAQPTQPGRGNARGASNKVWIIGASFFALGVVATVGFVVLRNNGTSETKTDTTVPITTHSAAPVATQTQPTAEAPAANPVPQTPPPTPVTPTPNPSPTPGPTAPPHPTTSASAKPTPSPLPVPSWVTIPTGLPTVIPSVFPNPFPPP